MKPPIMFFLTICLTWMTALSVHADPVAPGGEREGNGGDTAEMRRQLLSRDQVFDLLKNNGEKLKREVLLPLVTNVAPHMITDSMVQSSYATMTQGSLRDDVMYTYYDITSPECQNLGGANRAAQTEPVLRARVCFDVDYIARDGNTIGSIAGLALHEHAHHYGIDDHPYYRIANYFRGMVEAGNHLVPETLRTRDGSAYITFGRPGSPLLVDGMRIYAGDTRGNQNQNWAQQQYDRQSYLASQFCLLKGYSHRYPRFTSHVYPHRDETIRSCSISDGGVARPRSFAYIPADVLVSFFETISCLIEPHHP
jgi:hypothetical protein